MDFIKANTLFDQESAEAEVDRYIAQPGQAVTYKVGESAIKDLREKYVNRKDFPEIDVKKVHTAILNCQGPLDLLESCVQHHFQQRGLIKVEEPEVGTDESVVESS